MVRTKQWSASHLAAVAFAVVLAVPAAVALRDHGLRGQENRDLAPFPARPDSLSSALKYTEKLDRWINDHFGFRAFFVVLNNRLRFDLFRQFPTIQVIAGREGRIFLSAHATYHAPYSAITTPCGYTKSNTDDAAEQLSRFSSRLRGSGMDARILIAPSSPVLYVDQLPKWLEARCNASTPPIPAVLGSPRLDQHARESVFYPLAEMRALRRTMDVFPKTWFHWSGAGPRAVAGLSAEHFWSIGQDSGSALSVSNRVTNSDIGHLFPGVELTIEMLVADYDASGVQFCRGPACFPGIQGVAGKLGEVHTFHNGKATSAKLVILSDSFGQFIAGWYSRYFRDVLHLSTNGLNQLDAAEAEQFRQFVRRESQYGQLLFVYHDGSILDGRPARDLAVLVP
jgi:hypothetical protein